METGVKLGHILGIPVRLHVSWFLIFGLVTWSLAVSYFPVEYPALPTAACWALGVTTSLLFFGSVLAHELSHSLVALRSKVPVHGITLFIFGGVAQIGREPSTPGDEFRIAIAGPLSSLILAVGFGGLWLLNRTVPYLAAPTVWLMRINLGLALFNLIPGFPLDGGRVLRAIVWGITQNFRHATQVASFVGQLTALGFIGVGAFTMIGGNFANGLWLVLIGWFLQNAAAASYAQVTLQHSLGGVTVGQVMSHDCVLVPVQTTVAQLVEERILPSGRRCFFVTENDRPRGVLALSDIARVSRANWGQITAGQIMIPWDRAVRVQPETMLLAALKAMDDANVNQVPVVKGEEVVGMLSREHILHYVRTRAELGI